jgi:hypothetical protein
MQSRNFIGRVEFIAGTLPRLPRTFEFESPRFELRCTLSTNGNTLVIGSFTTMDGSFFYLNDSYDEPNHGDARFEVGEWAEGEIGHRCREDSHGPPWTRDSSEHTMGRKRCGE